MRRRAVRITLMLLAFGAIAAAAYLTWSADNRLSTARRSQASFYDAYTAAPREMYDLSSTQQAHVPAGQNETLRLEKSGASSQGLRAVLAQLMSGPQNTAIHAALEA